MFEINRRLQKLERQISGTAAERITITLGEVTLTFKNVQELRKLWISAAVASQSEGCKK